MFKKLKNNPELRVVDLGSGTNGSCPHADVLVDANDHSSHFPDKEFIVHDLDGSTLPFEDNEFDFCFASHILEHVTDPLSFLEEITRVSKSGYIEVPSPLIDNLVSGDDIHDPHGHKWWVFYDDVKEKVILRPRRHIVHKTVDIPELNKLYPFFRSSFVIELYWENSIEAEIGDEKYSYENNEYDLSRYKVQPWVLGASVLMRGRQ
jgi:ubiquinone/menaquinone biosynthesis C-methylase UbiE